MKALHTTYPLHIDYVSRGQYRLTSTRYAKKVSFITNDTDLIENIKDGKKSAINEAIRLVRLNAFLSR
jgi:hypothetical protein